MCGSLSLPPPFGKIPKNNRSALKNMRKSKRESRGLEKVPAFLLAMAGGLACPALAQDVPSNSQAAYPTNQPAWLNPAQPLTLSYGAFDLHPRLRSTTIYDDNILFATKGQQSDVISQIAPGMQILGGDRQTLETYLNWAEKRNYGLNLTQLSPASLVIQPAESWPDKFLLLDYSPQWQEFASHSANDSLDQFVTANGVWPMAKLIVGFQENYSDQKTIVSETATRSAVQQNHSELDACYVLNDKFSVATAFTRDEVDYPESTNLVGYTEWAGSVSLNRQVGATLNVSSVTAGGLDEVVAGQNQQFLQEGLRARYSYSERFGMDGSLGGEYRQYDSGHSATFTPYFSFGAVYQPWERMYLRIGVARKQFASLSRGYAYTSTGGYLTLHKDITDRLSLLTELNYFQYDYTSTDNTSNSSQPTDYYSCKLTADYKLWKHVTVQVYYVFRGDGLLENSTVLQDNQLGFQAAVRF